MTSSTIITPSCFSRNASLQVPTSIIDDMSTLKFDGEGETTLFEHISHFIKFGTKHNIHYEDVGCRLFILTFKGYIREWCHTCLMPPYYLSNIFPQNYFALVICMIINVCVRKFCNCENHLMNYCIIFTIISCIFVLNFLKMNLIGLSC